MPSTSMSPDPLAHYELLEKLGEGGMGVLYRARDLRLNRTVAIKVLRPSALGDPELTRRLLQEARTASALNHPHVVTIYEVDDRPEIGQFIAMEYIEGEPLTRRLSQGPLPVAEALRIAIEAAEGLAAAHAVGIVHRDVKPANVMLTSSGQVKLVDFGLAKVRPPLSETDDEEARATLSQGPHTRTGAILGTPAYMSPEQVEGRPADARSDVFSFGVVLYELLTGERPFRGATQVGLLSTILRDTPPPMRKLRPDVPEGLERVVERCLEKRPEARYATAQALRQELACCRDELAAKSLGPRLRRPAMLAAGGVLVVLLGLAAFAGLRLSRDRSARHALREAESMRETLAQFAAYRRARELRAALAGDPEFERFWRSITYSTSVRTEPEGALVAFKEYDKPESEWDHLGTSPLENAVLPLAHLRFRFVKEGFESLEATVDPEEPVVFRLAPKDGSPAGMVRIPGGPFGYRLPEPIELPDSWLDMYEVTNRQFKEFVDRGGYRTREYWKEPFAKEGQVVTWEQGMAEFRDSTGRPGPSTWELGSYPEGQAEFPVGGVSWYEAAAYAEFADKSLPTYHHWFKAAGLGYFSEILGLSNFGGRGPAPVGSHRGLSPWGNYDMAGNVREWASNRVGTRRYSLGGGWNDPTYLFGEPDAADPFERRPTFGFRCARYDTPPPKVAFEPVVEQVVRDYARERPVGDEAFAAYARVYAYDPIPLEARRDAASDDTESWLMERVSFAAAYGGERVPARLYLPRHVRPPYQAILYFPPGSGTDWPSSEAFPEVEFSFLVRSGRAVLFPAYQGYFERQLKGPKGPNARRDAIVHANQDGRRALDYLESRPDIDAHRMGLYATSGGASAGLRIAALDPRLRALVLAATGLPLEHNPPEIDRLNFAPRVHAPVLMVNGRSDFIFPLETAQRPLFRFLGTFDKDKRLALLEGGHILRSSKELIRETLDWFDRYLGPVAVGP